MLELRHKHLESQGPIVAMGIETQMKEATGKKRGGRPLSGRAPELCVTLPKQVLDAIDEIAIEEESTRSIVARDMIVDAIRRRGKEI
jgi:hypothetical protein